MTVSVKEDVGDLFVTLAADPDESLLHLLERGAAAVHERGVRIVSMTIFNGHAEYAAALQSLRYIFGEVSWPITWLLSEASACAGPAGLELQAVTDDQVTIRTLRLRDRI